MTVKGIIDEDFVNYKKPSMFIAFPRCSFKCDKESKEQVCQNGILATAPDIEISCAEVLDRYVNNQITSAIVCSGLEPFEQFDQVYNFIEKLRKDYNCDDTVLIYTGYNKEEITEQIDKLKIFDNIIIKFGRFIPGQKPHYDEVLGVMLASDNQYAARIS